MTIEMAQKWRGYTEGAGNLSWLDFDENTYFQDLHEALQGMIEKAEEKTGTMIAEPLVLVDRKDKSFHARVKYNGSELIAIIFSQGAIDELAQAKGDKRREILNALCFQAGHEIGHFALGHSGSLDDVADETQRREEFEADGFSRSLFRDRRAAISGAKSALLHNSSMLEKFFNRVSMTTHIPMPMTASPTPRYPSHVERIARLEAG